MTFEYRPDLSYCHEWKHLCGGGFVKELVQADMISINEAEFLESVRNKPFVTGRQAKWLEAIDQRTMFFQYQRANSFTEQDWDIWGFGDSSDSKQNEAFLNWLELAVKY